MPTADELHRSAQAKGKQELSNGKVTRWAICPVHSWRSSRFSHVEQDDGHTQQWWVFMCSENGVHRFRAKADPHAPKSVEEVAAWEQEQKAAQIRAMEKGQ